MKQTSEIGKIIYEYRMANDMSQEEIGNEIGISKDSVFKIEKGLYLRNCSFVIADWMHTTVEDIRRCMILRAETEEKELPRRNTLERRKRFDI